MLSDLFGRIFDDFPWKISTMGSLFTITTSQWNEYISMAAGLLTIAYTLLKCLEIVTRWGKKTEKQEKK